MEGTEVKETLGGGAQVVVNRETPKVDTKAAPVAKEAERPTWLPEKFKSVEDFAKSYHELEKRLGGGGKETPKDPPKEDPKAGAKETAPPAKTDTEKALEKAKVDLKKIEEEWHANGGKLSDETYKKLEESGFSKDAVDSEIETRQKAAQAELNEILGAAGIKDQEEWKAIGAWAEENISKDELEAYNEALRTAPKTAQKLILAGIKARYAQSAEYDGSRLGGGRTGGDSGGYESQAQMMEDMKNPKYKKDPAFRAMVDKKLERASWNRKG